MWPTPQLPADLVTFTEELLTGKLHFLCSETVNHAILENFMLINAKKKLSKLNKQSHQCQEKRLKKEILMVNKSNKCIHNKQTI